MEPNLPIDTNCIVFAYDGNNEDQEQKLETDSINTTKYNGLHCTITTTYNPDTESYIVFFPSLNHKASIPSKNLRLVLRSTSISHIAANEPKPSITQSMKTVIPRNKKCTCKRREEIKCSLLFAFYTFCILFMAIDISLLIININANKLSKRDSINYFCINDIISVIHTNEWMLIGSICGIIYGILSCIKVYTIWIVDAISHAKQCVVIWITFISIGLFILACMGFDVYGNLNDGCKDTIVGKIILSWSVVRVLSAVTDCGLLVLFCCCTMDFA
eukprot:260853_1